MAIDLDTLALEAFGAYTAAQSVEEARKADEATQKAAEAVTRLRSALKEAIPDLESLLPDLAEVVSGNGDKIQVYFNFEKAGWVWQLLCNGGSWHIRQGFELKSDNYRQYLVSSISPEQLREKLLVAVGARIKDYKAEQIEQAAKAAQLQEDRIREENERKERIAAANAEDARLRKLFAEARAAKKKALVPWVKGVMKVVFYRVTYFTGGFRDDESGKAFFDYGEDWTTSAVLDDGWIQIETKEGPHRIRLSDKHLPRWREYVCSSLEDVPAALKKPVVVSLPNVIKRRDSDGIFRLMEVASRSDMECGEHIYEEIIGEELVAWVAALTEAELASLTYEE